MDLGGTTVIVVGFPRSGTSMLMRMLYFGGVELLVDQEFTEVIHPLDPYGVLELSDINKQLDAHGPEWTANRAFKLITPNFVYLPLDRPVKAIFVTRDRTEVITSLMAKKLMFVDVDIDTSVATARWYLKRHNIPTLFLRYHQVLKYPKTTALQIQDFLGAEMNVDNMPKAVEPSARKRDGRFLTFNSEDYLGEEVHAQNITLEKDYV